jgi:hypothetical protein
MDIKSKNALVIIALISIPILTGSVLAPSFLNWGIERSLPVYNSSYEYHAAQSLKYNQYLINGEFITRNESTAWITTDNILLMIDITNQKDQNDFQICSHKEGDMIKYAVFVEGSWDWKTFILRRELC